MDAYAMTFDRESPFGCQFMDTLEYYLAKDSWVVRCKLPDLELYLLRNINLHRCMSLQGFEQELIRARRTTNDFRPDLNLVIRLIMENRSMLVQICDGRIRLRWSLQPLTFDDVLGGWPGNDPRPAEINHLLEQFDRTGVIHREHAAV